MVLFLKPLLLMVCLVIVEILQSGRFQHNTLCAAPLPPVPVKSKQILRETQTYSFGVVPQLEQRRIYHIWRPILDELEARTNIKFKMIGTAKIPDFTRKFLKGEFDFVYMNPYHVIQSIDTQGYIPLVRDGGRSLKGIIVVSKDSKLKTLNDLQGLTIAFPSANALGASLLNKSALDMQKIQYQTHYVQTHSSVYLHIAKKLYQAGGGILSTLISQKQQIKNSLRIIYQSPPVTPHPISAHPRVVKEIRLKVKNALLEMSKSKHFQNYLNKIPIKKMTAATIDEYMSLRELHLERLYISEKIN
ncbi:Phosphonate ABC transporter phosphate-binding periplasmic component (TC 3.A.1.9.1) [hydrothermal vent metagenome]|uniref:Phosphonate ABC transporter phosphate-binding periplasmic component (TC 3.A.1.9.1) n=1 Tax=hydrothermal vent metagenome TaxID=652676 RepID=A0A3B0ZYU1_9ZZZZ